MFFGAFLGLLADLGAAASVFTAFRSKMAWLGLEAEARFLDGWLPVCFVIFSRANVARFRDANPVKWIPDFVTSLISAADLACRSAICWFRSACAFLNLSTLMVGWF